MSLPRSAGWQITIRSATTVAVAVGVDDGRIDRGNVLVTEAELVDRLHRLLGGGGKDKRVTARHTRDLEASETTHISVPEDFLVGRVVARVNGAEKIERDEIVLRLPDQIRCGNQQRQRDEPCGLAGQQDEELCETVKISGLGLPGEMQEYTANGCAPEFALWSFHDLGYLTYYAVAVPATEPQP